MPAPISRTDFAVSTRADWVQSIQVSDNDTGDLIDLTGALINVRITDEEGCQKFAGTVGDGITIDDIGVFTFTVPAATMSTLCAGSYPIGSIYNLNGETNDIFIGTVTVVENPGRL